MTREELRELAAKALHTDVTSIAKLLVAAEDAVKEEDYITAVAALTYVREILKPPIDSLTSSGLAFNTNGTQWDFMDKFKIAQRNVVLPVLKASLGES